MIDTRGGGGDTGGESVVRGAYLRKEISEDGKNIREEGQRL